MSSRAAASRSSTPSPAVARRVVQLLDRYGLHVDPAHRAEYTFRTFADEAYRLRLERKPWGHFNSAGSLPNPILLAIFRNVEKKRNFA